MGRSRAYKIGFGEGNESGKVAKVECREDDHKRWEKPESYQRFLVLGLEIVYRIGLWSMWQYSLNLLQTIQLPMPVVLVP